MKENFVNTPTKLNALFAGHRSAQTYNLAELISHRAAQ